MSASPRRVIRLPPLLLWNSLYTPFSLKNFKYFSLIPPILLTLIHSFLITPNLLKNSNNFLLSTCHPCYRILIPSRLPPTTINELLSFLKHYSHPHKSRERYNFFMNKFIHYFVLVWILVKPKSFYVIHPVKRELCYCFSLVSIMLEVCYKFCRAINYD